MLTSDLLTADEAAKLLRIGRRTFDAHVARGDIAYIAVGMGLKRTRKRFDPADLAQFREQQRRVECPPELSPKQARGHVSGSKSVDFAAILRERREERKADREKRVNKFGAK
ncbi:helix-turn-helix domain-containing protein [Methylobacterium sp. SD21]|uniref:helix-turn-helix domain-containing protein n=1 Tax=Methylobacterium litchii TaxID=3138810 RepID=UPI00313DEF82